MEEDSYNEIIDTHSDILYDDSFINENNNEYNESEVPWVRSNCNSDSDIVSMEPYEQTSVDNHDLYVIKTLDNYGKFTNVNMCNLKSSLISQLWSNRNEYPSMIKCIYGKPDDDIVRRTGEQSLLNGMCCKPTDIFVILVDTILITLQSFIDLISTDTQIWYAVPLYSGKRKRIGNVRGVIGASMDHGQVPGSFIYKLYTKEQILSGIKPEETNLYPLNDFIFFNDNTINYTDVRDLIRNPNEITTTQVLRIIDILTRVYTNNKLKKTMRYNYIFSNTKPSDYSLQDIKFLINNHDNAFLPHWLHPNAKTTSTRDNDGEYHTVGYYNLMDKDIKPVIPSRNLFNNSSQMRFILHPGYNISNEEFTNLRDNIPQQPQQNQRFNRLIPEQRQNHRFIRQQSLQRQQYLEDARRLEQEAREGRRRERRERREQEAREEQETREEQERREEQETREERRAQETREERREQERREQETREERRRERREQERIVRRRCKPDEEINEANGRCRKKCSPDQVRNERTGRCRKLQRSIPVRRCKPDEERNEANGRCRKKCSPAQVRNERTGRCRKRIN